MGRGGAVRLSGVHYARARNYIIRYNVYIYIYIHTHSTHTKATARCLEEVCEGSSRRRRGRIREWTGEGQGGDGF